MTAAEVAAVDMIKSEGTAVLADMSSRRLFVCKSAAKRRKLLFSGTAQQYRENRFITQTSNVCERFFSVAKATIGDLSRRLRTENKEAQMLLH